jgi:hypothetical protein
MSVLNRKMFGRGYAMGGPVKSSRGVGITSGLDTPKRGYVDGPGSYSGKIEEDYQTYFDLLSGAQGERPEFDRLEANTPALLALSSALMSGKSLQGGLGGALDIAGQALGTATPYFAQAIAAKKAYDAADPAADLRTKALEMAIENQPDKDEEKFTGKESFKAKIKVPSIEEGGEPTTITRDITRFVSNYGNVQYKDQYNNVITDFTPIEKKDTFEGPDGYQYSLNEDGVSATKIEGQGAAVSDENIQMFQGKDGFQYMVRVDPDDPTKVTAVLLPGQGDVENDPTLFKGPDGFTYMLNASNQAEIIPGQNAADKPIKTFKGADGRTYMLDEDSKQAVLIPGQPEADEPLEMFEGPNGIQYQVVDGEASKIPGQDDEIKEPKQPKTGLWFNEKFKSDDNPRGLVPANFEYDEVKERYRWFYEAPDGTIKPIPAEGSMQISVTSDTGSFESTVNSVKTNLLNTEISTRQAIASINNAIEFVIANPGANTIMGEVAAFSNEIKAEINQVLRVLGKGKLETTDVLNLNTYNNKITLADGTTYDGWESLGIRTNEMKSKLLDLAYVVAAARGQTGRALSDKDVARFLKILGTDRADYKSVVATLTGVKERLAEEYAISHNVFSEQYDGINSVPTDYLLKPIGEYRDDQNQLIDPFDFNAIAEEVDSELKG